MKTFAIILLECCKCGRQVSLNAASVESRLDEPLSMNNVGQLYGKLRCSNCASRQVRISDDAGRMLIDPATLKPCRIFGCAIPMPRLKAMPGTDTCVSCAFSGARQPVAIPYPHPPLDKQKCPRCGSPTIVRQNNEDQGYFLGCTGFPKCRWTTPLNQ
jgi:hypothetical protein